MHLAPLIRDLAVILGVAGLMSVLFQRIRQPVVLGYIIAGIFIGPHTPPFQLVTDLPSIQTWAELGVIFLMFTLGLEFSFRKLARVGGSAILTAGMEVAFFIPVGYGVGQLMGWSFMDSLFLGAMLSISSTTIIIKALDELKLKKHRFAELIFAVLIVEDLIAILLLVALSTVAVTQSVSASHLGASALRLVLVVGGWFLVGYLVVPRFMRYVGRSENDEILTILSLGLCLALVVFANHFGYSTALGAFIMGSILAESPALHRIESAMASLRDLFGAVFFVSIGMLIDPRTIIDHWGTVAILCAVTIVGKIISTGFGALVSGQSVRNSVQVGFGLAQIGEFSFIIAQLGMSLKVIGEQIYPIIVAVSLVTTFTTPYLIRFSGRAATILEAALPARVLELLNRYAAHAESRRALVQGRKGAFRPYFRWILNGILVSVVFLGSHQLTLDRELAPFVGWGAALVLSLPFIWGMLTAFRAKDVMARALTSVLSLLCIGALSSSFFPARYVLLAATGVLAVALAVFYRRLESSYHWFETNFLSSFEMAKEGRKVPAHLKHLAPWDAHLIRMELDPNSPLILKKISDAALRVKYGINIVAIQRGKKTIVSPMPQELLLPKDELILLGTDEQVDQLRQELQAPDELSAASDAAASYELRQAMLSASSNLVGQSIRQSGIRERHRAIVVGIERDGHRKINPDSDFRLEEGDVLWIAGEHAQLDELAARLKGPLSPDERRQ